MGPTGSLFYFAARVRSKLLSKKILHNCPALFETKYLYQDSREVIKLSSVLILNPIKYKHFTKLEVIKTTKNKRLDRRYVIVSIDKIHFLRLIWRPPTALDFYKHKTFIH